MRVGLGYVGGKVAMTYRPRSKFRSGRNEAGTRMDEISKDLEGDIILAMRPGCSNSDN